MADAAVVDSRQVEAQTKKLFEVVKHRGIPVFTFMNKLDRDGQKLFARTRRAQVLQVIQWTGLIGWGKLWGLVWLYNQRLELYKGDERFASLEDGDKLAAILSTLRLRTIPNFLQEAGNEFSEGSYFSGELTLAFLVQPDKLWADLSYIPSSNCSRTMTQEKQIWRNCGSLWQGFFRICS